MLHVAVNYELHRRKTFWVDEALVYRLAQTDLDIPGEDLRVPFPCFALVFTDRHVLSLCERLVSADSTCPLAGHLLRVAIVYVTEEQGGPTGCCASRLLSTPSEPTRRICSSTSFR